MKQRWRDRMEASGDGDGGGATAASRVRRRRCRPRTRRWQHQPRMGSASVAADCSSARWGAAIGGLARDAGKSCTELRESERR